MNDQENSQYDPTKEFPEGIVFIDCQFRTGRGKVIDNAHDHQGGVPMTAVYTVTLRGNFGQQKKDDLKVELYREQPHFTKQPDAWEYKAMDIYTDTDGCCVEISLRRVRFLCSTFKAEGTRFVIRVTSRSTDLDARSDGFVTRARNPHSGNGNRRPSAARRHALSSSPHQKSSPLSKQQGSTSYTDNDDEVGESHDEAFKSRSEKIERGEDASYYHNNNNNNNNNHRPNNNNNINNNNNNNNHYICQSLRFNKTTTSKNTEKPRNETETLLECLQGEPLDIDKFESLLTKLDVDELDIMSSVINEFLQSHLPSTQQPSLLTGRLHAESSTLASSSPSSNYIPSDQNSLHESEYHHASHPHSYHPHPQFHPSSTKAEYPSPSPPPPFAFNPNDHNPHHHPSHSLPHHHHHHHHHDEYPYRQPHYSEHGVSSQPQVVHHATNLPYQHSDIYPFHQEHNIHQHQHLDQYEHQHFNQPPNEEMRNPEFYNTYPAMNLNHNLMRPPPSNSNPNSDEPPLRHSYHPFPSEHSHWRMGEYDGRAPIYDDGNTRFVPPPPPPPRSSVSPDTFYQ